jgi:2-(1,2-epoxy-1,2-dihydrophenyl)acetyl-CoA isomerase
VITGAGDAFCAGADLGYVRREHASDPARALLPLVEAVHAVIRRIRSLPIPVIAAVEGPAVGAGMGIALAADLRVLGHGASLVPGFIRIGASPDSGVSWLLTRAIGGARASALILRNRPLGAEPALDLGLADAVTDAGQALTAAVKLASEVSGTPPQALLFLRELTDRATVNTLDRHLDLEQQRIIQIWETDDFAEGIAAFLQKRAPAFGGATNAGR